jgi:transcriptional regulator with GAF, ATPase, and Fis domain
VLAIATAGPLPSDQAWHLLRHGASDDQGPLDERRLPTQADARLARWREIDGLVESPLVQDNLVGRSVTWIGAMRRLVEMARFTDDPILVLGETGTGKELAARLVHSLDRRVAKRGLMVVDCGTIAPELSGSEFFGHERGAFTGAMSARDGAFAAAAGGTLFIDEIGDLPLALQPELLRAVQEHTYKRLGSNHWQQVDFRLVSATNHDLGEDVAEGRFRRDLYYRIASLCVTLPPLRERPEDVLPLSRHFVAQCRAGEDPPEIDPVVAGYLVRRSYPGNVRDLKHLIGRIMHRHVGDGPITPGDVPDDERPPGDPAPDWRDRAFEGSIRRAVIQGVDLREIGRAATEAAISIAVEVEGTVHGAARRLGVTDRALQIRRAARRASRFADQPA